MGLGIDPRAEAVYRRMLFHPKGGMKQLAYDPESVAHARDLIDLGAQVRTTALRFASEIMTRLSARSRFQAGVNAVRHGHPSSD